MDDLDALREALAHADFVHDDGAAVLLYRDDEILNAAREFLRLKETGETWTVCLEHKSVRYPHTVDHRCHWVICEGNWKIDTPCRMVEALLTVREDVES